MFALGFVGAEENRGREGGANGRLMVLMAIGL